ncbi:peptidyl-prolyl cis-trans isomerase [bacterium]|nr:peptidyl-prolyl cis-trans isomerase [bacterium]
MSRRWYSSRVIGTALLLAVSSSFTWTAYAQMGGGQGPQNAPNRLAAEKDKLKKNRPKYPTSFQNKGFNSFTIAAVVDDQVILLEDVLASIRPELDVRRKQMPPAQFQEFEKQRIQGAVKNRIQQQIVLNELKKKVPNAEALDRIRQAASGDFEKYMSKVANDNKMKSRDDLIAQLKKEGTDLETLKSNFVDNMIAMQYLNSLIVPKLTDSTREQMEEFYQENIARWSTESGAVWRQIEVKKGNDPGKAQQKIKAIQAELQAGGDFGEIAKKSSEGPTSRAGGLWSRVSKGSYADPLVDKAIFSIPVGEVSPIIDGQTSYHLIRVEERNDGSPKPFVDVQDEIRNELKRRQIEKQRKVVVDKFAESHRVETMFDEAKTETAESETLGLKR